MDAKLSSKTRLCDVCQNIDLRKMIAEWKERVERRGPDPGPIDTGYSTGLKLHHDSLRYISGAAPNWLQRIRQPTDITTAL